jgi:uncharacterized protein YcbX
MPTLDRITVYPVKSLDGVEVSEARLLPGGGLEHDRRWQVVDMEGRVVNTKRTPLVHAIRAEFTIAGLATADTPPGRSLGGAGGEAPGNLPALGPNVIALAIDPAALAAAAVPGIERLAGLAPDVFPLMPGSAGPCGWVAEALGFGVLLVERADGGFPDDRDAAGPTLAASATLAEVARWFALDLAEARRRFRVNLELGGCDAFWEDTLASPARPGLPSLADLPPGIPADPYADLPPPEPRELTIGGARLRAVNVCRRCVVPTRDSRTGAETAHFRDAFEARRHHGMRPDVDASAWSHCYRLGVNTVGRAAVTLRIGDVVAAAGGP